MCQAGAGASIMSVRAATLHTSLKFIHSLEGSFNGLHILLTSQQLLSHMLPIGAHSLRLKVPMFSFARVTCCIGEGAVIRDRLAEWGALIPVNLDSRALVTSLGCLIVCR